MAIIDFYDRGWRLNPDGIAYIQGDRNYTFQEIGELSCRIANGLLAAGFAKEAKAAVWADNDVIGWSCALGMWRAGLAYIPVNGRNAVAENQYVLDAFDCEVLFFHQAFAAAIDALRPSLPKIRLWVCLDADLPWAPSLAISQRGLLHPRRPRYAQGSFASLRSCPRGRRRSRRTP